MTRSPQLSASETAGSLRLCRGSAVVCLLAIVTCLWSGEAQAAATLQIQPVRLTLSAAAGGSGKFAVINRGDTAVVLQVRLFTWGQDAAGHDVLAPSSDVLFTPSIMRVERDSRQTVRFAFRPGVTADAISERAFRIFLDELPQSAPDLESVSPAGTLIRMRYMLPLFAGGEKGRAGPVAVEVKRGREGCVFRLLNKGTRHVRVSGFHALHQNKSFKIAAPRYLLPGVDVGVPCPSRYGIDHDIGELKLETNVGVFPRGDSWGPDVLN